MISNIYWSFEAQAARAILLSPSIIIRAPDLLRIKFNSGLQGGTAGGSCAGGFGVCCYFEAECGRTYSVNSTKWSTTSTSPCTLTVCKASHKNIFRQRCENYSLLVVFWVRLGCAILLRAQHCIDITLQITRISKKVPACHSCFCTVP